MKKVIAAVLLVLSVAVIFAGCSKRCKQSGCAAEVYKKGYCKVHYAAHYPLEAAEDLGKEALEGIKDIGKDALDSIGDIKKEDIEAFGKDALEGLGDLGKDALEGLGDLGKLLK